MSEAENNLLLRLHKWARRQDENFHTEALVHLLRHLIQYERVAAANILKAITGEALNLASDEAALVRIDTQVITSKGTPDIEIKTSDCLIYVEVKVESGLGDLQLERYRQVLRERNDFRNTSLILLTRYPFVSREGEEEPDAVVRWYQVAELLEGELEDGTIKETVSKHVAEQFLGFLRERGMTMEKVSEQLIQGVQSLRNLLDMVSEALVLKGIRPKIHSGQDDYGYDSGYSFKLGSGEYWLGIEYDWPHILLFVTLHKIDEGAYRQLKLGRVGEGQWIHELDLSSEETGFFVLSKSDQLQCIEQFLKKSLDVVRQIQLTQTQAFGE
jgi:hypothetical protein